MKTSLCRLLSAVTLLALPTTLLAADISVDSATIFRFERREIPGATAERLFPATEFLGLDADKLADGNLSLHLYGWGRVDLADKSFNDRTVDGSLTYGYLQYRLRPANADLRLGRFFVREGIAIEQLDGLSVRSDLPAGFGLSAFGGATVHGRKLFGENSDGKGNALAGGRVNYRYNGVLELGLSGVYESKAPTLLNYTNGNHRLLGGDIWLSPYRVVELIGHTSYNPERKGVAEHSYLLNLKPLHHLVLTGEFNEHRERNYLYAWSMFSGAALNPDDKSRSTGGRVSYELAKSAELVGDYKHYVRDKGAIKPDADRFGGELRFRFLDNRIRSGIGYHYLRAGKEFAIGNAPSASYHELRTYALYDSKTYFSSADLLGYFFKDKVYNEKSAWEGSASIGYHITPALALSGDVSYGRNPEFTEEVKGLVRLTYNMLYKTQGGKQ